MNNRLLYELDSVPRYQNRTYDSEREAQACPIGDIRLVENLETGLVYNDAFRPELMEYDFDYDNGQASSPCFREHLRTISEIVIRYIGRQRVIELGCGQGQFLEILLARGCDVTGFDPAYSGTNPKISKGYFKPDTPSLPCEGFVLRHLLEHIPDPFSFLCMLRDANGGKGKIYIEVPCFDWICRHKTWFDLFYEHVNYFRIVDFQRMLGKIYYAQHSFGGQYLSIVADLQSLRAPSYCPAHRVEFPSDIFRQPAMTAGSAIWGAGSKGAMFALVMKRLGFLPKLAIDIHQKKQGRYLPGTGLKIWAPKEAMEKLGDDSVIYVMNSRYLEEVKDMSGGRFRYISLDA